MRVRVRVRVRSRVRVRVRVRARARVRVRVRATSACSSIWMNFIARESQSSLTVGPSFLMAWVGRGMGLGVG